MMNNLDPAIYAFFIQKLRSYEKPGKEDIHREVLGGQDTFQLTKEQVDEFIEQLERNFGIQQSHGNIVKGSDHEPWLQAEKQQINFFYWNRLKQYYDNDKQFPRYVVDTLDNVTDEILDFCGNPAEDQPWKRRGMVIGHIQSGKTTNYASLICKAADAGYKIIILLAGVNSALRKQTQERIDETFIGVKSEDQSRLREEMPILQYGRDRIPAYGTTRTADFSKDVAKNLGISLENLKDPIVFVTKKNKTTLERLQQWLREQNGGKEIQEPVLLIDDEADNASINTSKKSQDVTAINRAIRGILSLFARSSYVAYTATPFANIFINPDSYDDMIQDDLFPKDFIKALDPPTNYLGATRLFGEQADLYQMVVHEVNDYKNLIPLKHKKYATIPDLPYSLYQAIRIFVLTRAISILQGRGNKNSTMMINVSRFNDVQEQVSSHVLNYLENLKNAVMEHSESTEEGVRDSNIQALKRDFGKEFSHLCHWKNIVHVLQEAISPVSVKTINRKHGWDLGYNTASEQGVHVIANGGLTLSRGLTLEGLTVSYVLRNASAADTLLQMGRWFGYREHYEDLCRLYLPTESIEHYEVITASVEELRTMIKDMEGRQKTPADFGLRVRQSPTAIKITAPNKMRSAEEITEEQDYQGRHVEGYILKNDKRVNRENERKILDFVKELGKPYEQSNSMLWTDIDSRHIVELLKDFEFGSAHPDLSSINGETSLFHDYLRDRLEHELQSWSVVLPFNRQTTNGSHDYELCGKSIKLRSRESGYIRNGNYHVTKKARLANRGDELLDFPDEQKEKLEQQARDSNMKLGTYINLARSRPMLLVHLFQADINHQASDAGLEITPPVASLSFCMPSTRIPSRQRRYMVNPVYKKNLEEQFGPEPEDDEDEE